MHTKMHVFYDEQVILSVGVKPRNMYMRKCMHIKCKQEIYVVILSKELTYVGMYVLYEGLSSGNKYVALVFTAFSFACLLMLPCFAPFPLGKSTT
jgi:hypothetical protein